MKKDNSSIGIPCNPASCMILCNWSSPALDCKETLFSELKLTEQAIIMFYTCGHSPVVHSLDKQLYIFSCSTLQVSRAGQHTPCLQTTLLRMH